MPKQSTLKQNLFALDKLIKRERTALIYSQMECLEKLQLEKNSLLVQMQKADKVMDQESHDLAIRIRKNNRRNGLLLRAGFKLIHNMRQDVNRRRSSTYSAQGRAMTLSICPKIVKQSA